MNTTVLRMLRLNFVELTTIRDVEPDTRMRFGARGAALIGRNGTGKTRLLEYIAALCRGDASPFVASGEDFDVMVGVATDHAKARLRITGVTTSSELRRPVVRYICELTGAATGWTYHLSIAAGEARVQGGAADAQFGATAWPVPAEAPFARALRIFVPLVRRGQHDEGVAQLAAAWLELEGLLRVDPCRAVKPRPTHAGQRASLGFGEARFHAQVSQLAAHRHISVVDNPELGLDAEHLQQLKALSEGHQVIYASHDPRMIDRLWFESESDVAEQLIRCERRPEGYRWSNIAAEDAHVAYGLYEAGIQHVSEILRTRGW